MKRLLFVFFATLSIVACTQQDTTENERSESEHLSFWWPKHDSINHAYVMAADSHAMDTLRRRAGVMGFRAGMLCYLLENHKYTKTVGAFAEWVAEYVFRNQMELWGEQMEQDLTGALDAQTERGSAASCVYQLAEWFGLCNLVAERGKRLGRSCRM